MDTMKVLLGAIVGLLLGLVVLSFTRLGGEKDAEIARLKAEIERQKQSALTANQTPAAAPVAPVAAPEKPAVAPETAQRLAELERQVQMANQRQAELEEEARKAADAARAAEISTPETDPDFDVEPELSQADEDKREKRARQIVNALPVGRITMFNEEFNFAAFAVLRGDLISSDMELGIRRNRGIIGRVKVTSIEGQEGAVEPQRNSFFKGVDVQAGDELIIPPL